MRWSARDGSEEFATSIHTLGDATLGTLWDWRTPTEMTPSDQLEFWSWEVDRILAEHPGDAELHAAAAMMFHEPAIHFLSDLVAKAADDSSVAPLLWSSSVFDALTRSRTRFEREGGARAVALMESATDLEPDNPAWWRLRAALLRQSLLSKQGTIPRIESWRNVLAEARQHDPDNGLYDLLEESWCSTGCIDYDPNANPIVGDRQAWRDKIRLSQSLVNCKHVTLGEPAMKGLVRLHALSSHPTPFASQSIRSKFVATLPAQLISVHARNLIWMSKVLGETPVGLTDDEICELAIRANKIALDKSDATARYSNIIAMTNELAWQTKLNLEQANGQTNKETKTELDDAIRWKSAIQVASNKLKQRKTATFSLANSIVSNLSLSFLSSLLGLTIATFTIWLVAVRSLSSIRLRVWPFALFVGGVAASFFLLGIGPANEVPQQTQHWTLTAIALATLTLLLAGVARRSQLRFRYSVRSLLIASAIAAVLLQLAFHFQIGWSQLGFPIAIHAEPDQLLAVASQGGAMGTQLRPAGQWNLGPEWMSQPILEWHFHDGPLWSVGIGTVFFLVGIVWRKSERESIAEILSFALFLTLLFANLWAFLEPRNYISSRPRQIALETYIRSVEEYYGPIARDVETALDTGA